jgi:transketolase
MQTLGTLEGQADRAAIWAFHFNQWDQVSGEVRIAQVQTLARQIRVRVLLSIQRAGLGHIGGDFSVADILATLYGDVLRVDPMNPTWPERDRLILSKGHCAAALYSALAYRGFFAVTALETFMAPLSPLNGHPDRKKVPGVETNTGPLGHGLPVAVGTAIAARMSESARKTYVVLGDGELQEGSNWEAIMYAGHLKLESLTAIVDRNRLQQGARTEDTNGLDPLEAKWSAFGWEVLTVNGHDIGALIDALTAPRHGRPRVLIANTIKGKGVSFIEDRVEWHHKVPSTEQVALALEELGGEA